MFKATRYLLLLMLVGVVAMLCSCAQPPTQEMDAAKAAIDKAISAGADKYATAELEAAKSALSQAEEKVTAKDYEAAKTLAIEAADKAAAAEAAIAAGKEKVKAEVDAMMPEAQKAFAALQKQVKLAKANKKAAVELKTTLEGIPAVETELKDAKTAYDAGDFAGAKDKITAAKSKIDEASKAITGVIGVAKKPAAKKAVAKKPVKKTTKKKK